MSWRARPDAATASCTTGMMNSTSLRSRSRSAVTCANETTATSLIYFSLLSRLQVVAVRLVRRVRLAVGLEPLQAPRIGPPVLVPDRLHPHAHPDQVDIDALDETEVRRVGAVEQ